MGASFFFLLYNKHGFSILSDVLLFYMEKKERCFVGFFIIFFPIFLREKGKNFVLRSFSSHCVFSRPFPSQVRILFLEKGIIFFSFKEINFKVRFHGILLKIVNVCINPHIVESLEIFTLFMAKIP